MGVLAKKLLRELWGAKGQVFAALLVISLGILNYIGLQATYLNLKDASEQYYEKYHFADLNIDMFHCPAGMAGLVREQPYVRMASGRVVKDVKSTIKNNPVLRMITLPDEREPVVNDIKIVSGHYFTGGAGQGILEDEFFKANNLKLGDTLPLLINGKETKITIVGTAKSPEYVYLIKDGSQFLPDYKKFGVLYVPQSYGQSVLGYSGVINNISVILKAGADSRAAKKNLTSLLKNRGLIEITEKKDQLSNSMLQSELSSIKSMSRVLPFCFLLVASIIMYMMMLRMIETQRRQIGNLKAMGFGDMTILLHYLGYPLIIGVMGGALGSLGGIYSGNLMTNMENQFFHLPLEYMKIYPGLILPAFLFNIGFCLLAGYQPCRKILKIMPAEAIRTVSPEIGKKIFLEKIIIFWSNITFIWKLVFRNIFRNKKRFLLTAVGVIFSTALLVMAFGMKDSTDFLMDRQINKIQLEDIKVDFANQFNLNDLQYIKQINHVVAAEPMLKFGVTVSNGWKEENVGFTALPDDNKLYNLLDEKDNPVSLPSGGILLEGQLMKKLGIKVGDRVQITPLLPGKDKKYVTVKGAVAQYLGINAYSGYDQACRLLGEGPSFNSAALRLDDPRYSEYVRSELKKIPQVNVIETRKENIESINEILQFMITYMAIILALSGALAVSVIYNTSTISILERQRELALFKVLGFNKIEIGSIVYYENLVVLFVGLLAGLPAGYLLNSYIMNMYNSNFYSFPPVVYGHSYLYSALIVFVFSLLAQMLVLRKINSIKMAEVLKSQD